MKKDYKKDYNIFSLILIIFIKIGSNIILIQY